METHKRFYVSQKMKKLYVLRHNLMIYQFQGKSMILNCAKILKIYMRLCYVDGVWRGKDLFRGRGKISSIRGSSDNIMGDMKSNKAYYLCMTNVKFYWIMEYIKILKFSSRNRFFLTGDDGAYTNSMTWFHFLHEWISTMCPNFTIQHIPRENNIIVGKLSWVTGSVSSTMIYAE